MGLKNQPMHLDPSREGFGARKNGDDLGHELIWAIAWNEASRRTARYSRRAWPSANEHSQPMNRALRILQADRKEMDE